MGVYVRGVAKKNFVEGKSYSTLACLYVWFTSIAEKSIAITWLQKTHNIKLEATTGQ